MLDSLAKIGKKALTWSVVSTTIAWSLGASALVAPLSASAVTLGAGSLIKLRCSTARPDVNDPCKAVYFYAANGKRYVFPHEKTYKTWYPDFSGVVQLSFEELSAIGIGGNVVARSGTRLVKITTDAKVYAVEPNGRLRAIPSETVAAQLYGSTWNQRVDDVSDAFFTNYTVGADVESGKYPTGSLVMSGADTWYVDGTTRRKVTADGMTANRYQTGSVITTTLDLSSLTAGTDLSTSEFADTSQGGGTAASTTPAGTPAGTGLTLSTSATQAVGASIVTDSDALSVGGSPTGGQNSIPFTKMKFMASADGPVTVTELTVVRGGISADADVARLYIYNGDEVMVPLAESGSMSSGRVKFSNTNGLFTVPAGGSSEITLRGNVAEAVSSGKTVSYSLAAADVKTSNTAAVTGSAAGNVFTVAAISNLGQLQVRNISPTAATNVDPQNNFELWRFSLTAGDQDLMVKSLVLTQVGSVDGDDIQNFKIMDGATQVGSTVALMSNNKLSIDLGTGLEIKSGVTKQLGLRGDILGGTNRTYRFSVQNRYDVLAWDKNYNVYVGPVRVTNGGTNNNSFSVVEANDGTDPVSATIRTGRLVISVASDSPSGNVPDGATNVLLAKFTFTAAGEDVKVNSLVANCEMSVTTDDLVNTKLIFDGSQVGSTDSTANCTGAEDMSFSFGSSFIVPAGATKVLEVRGDLTSDTIGAADTIKINLEAGSSNAEGRVSLTSLSTSSAGSRTVTVRGNAVVVTRNASIANWSSTRPTAVLGATNKLIGSFVITGGGEDADVTQIVMNDDVATDTLADAFQNLKLVADDGIQFGTTVGTLTDTTNTDYTFTPATPLRVTAGGSRVINVYVDVRNPLGTSAAIGNFQTVSIMNAESVTATGVLTGTAASDTTSIPSLQQVYLAVQGNLTVAADGATPRRSQEVMGSNGIEFTRIKLTADVNEDISVSQLVVADTFGAMTYNKLTTSGVYFGAFGATGTLKNLKLVDVATGTQVGGTVVALDDSQGTGSTSTPVAIFSNIPNLIVPRDGSVTLKLVADVQTATNGGVSSSTHRLSIRNNYRGSTTTTEPVTATGRDSGITISGSCLDIGATQTTCAGAADSADTDANGNFHDVFRTKITIALAPGTPAGGSRSQQADSIISIFRISNSANAGNYDATIELLNFDIGSTLSPTCTGAATSTCSAIKLFKTDTSNANLLWTTNASGNIGTSALYPSATATADGDLTDEVIAAGNFKDFIATISTSAATGAASSSRNLTVSLSLGGIQWGDSTTTDIIMVDSLPVSGNTMLYAF